jgi:hypothetical protein
MMKRLLILLLASLLPHYASAAIALASSGVQATPAQNCVVPVTISINDYLIAHYTSDGSVTTISSYGAPLVQTFSSTSNSDGMVFFGASGQATAGASSITTTSQTSSSVNNIIGQVLAFSGVDQTTPNDATPVTSNNTDNVASTANISITTVTANTWLVLPVGMDHAAATDPVLTINDHGAGLSWTVVHNYEAGGFRKQAVAYALKPTPGAITVTGNFSINVAYGAVLYALRPAADAGGSTGFILKRRKHS